MPMRCTLRQTTLAFCLRLLCGCAPSDQADADPTETQRATPELVSTAADAGGPAEAAYGLVASEFLPIEEIEAALPLLERHRLNLMLAWPAEEIDNSRWYEVVRSANARGVSVFPWLTLADEDGYFANSANAPLFDATMRRLVERWLEQGLAPVLVAVDMEAPIARAHEFVELVAQTDTAAITEFLRKGIDRKQYAEATAVYAKMVDFLHENGFQVEVSALAMVLDDYEDGDDGLRQGLQVPIDGIAWDRYTFQLHRTLARFSLGELIGPHSGYFVYDYARRARQRFGERAAAYLGLTDPGISANVTVYSGPEELREDVEAARAAGLARDHIGVFSLRGLVTRTDQAQWFAPARRFSRTPLPDVATTLMRASSVLLDSSL